LTKITVFNEKSTSHSTGKYPLFFGEEPSLYDSVNQPYPYLYELMEKLKQLDWSENDVDLTETRMDLLRCDKNTRELMLLNLAYQWSLDSIATSIPTLLAPFVTNSEYGHLLARIGENENLHSNTYSNIVRQCISDPQEVFDMVFENEKVLERSSVVGKALSELKEYGAKYTLGLATAEECRPYVLKGVVAIYALERISFMASFSCTFALAQQEYFVGAARLVQKILMDEMIHYEAGRYVLQDIMKKDPEWVDYFEKYEDELIDIIHGVVEQELSWNKYLFSSGRNLVGMNEGILNDWVRYNAQEVFDVLQLQPKFRKTTTCPLPWFENDWMDLNSQQNANMEADATNYMVSSVSKDVSKVDFSDVVFDEFGQELPEKPEYLVYSKPNCPYCVRVKTFMSQEGMSYREITVTQEEKEYLTSLGLTTVPQVFTTGGDYKGDCTKFISDNS
jgi:ribonucleoside-diphosphate reductase beta chain